MRDAKGVDEQLICRVFIVMLNVVMASVIMLRVVALSLRIGID
jgi:hypothetical protein